MTEDKRVRDTYLLAFLAFTASIMMVMCWFSRSPLFFVIAFLSSAGGFGLGIYVIIRLGMNWKIYGDSKDKVNALVLAIIAVALVPIAIIIALLKAFTG